MAKYYAVVFSDDFLMHYGRSKKDGAPVGSGRPASTGSMKIDNNKDSDKNSKSRQVHEQLKANDPRYRSMCRYLAKDHKLVVNDLHDGRITALKKFATKIDTQTAKYFEANKTTKKQRELIKKEIMNDFNRAYQRKNPMKRAFDTAIQARKAMDKERTPSEIYRDMLWECFDPDPKNHSASDKISQNILEDIKRYHDDTYDSYRSVWQKMRKSEKR